MMAIVFVWQQDTATAALVLFTVIGLGLLSVADLESGKIPNRLVYPFAGFTWAGVMALAVASGDGPRLVQAVGVTVLYTSVFSVLWFLGHLGAGVLGCWLLVADPNPCFSYQIETATVVWVPAGPIFLHWLRTYRIFVTVS